MNEKDLEFGELNLDDIMKEFGADVDAFDADLEDTQDLLAAINGIEEMTAEQESDPEETENQEPEQEVTEEPAAEETAEPAEPAQPVPEEPVEETQEMDDTVRLDDLSQITGTTPSVGHKLEDKTERLDPIVDEDEDSVEIKIPAPIIFRPKQRLRELKRDLIAGPEKRYYELSEKGVGKLQAAMLVCLLVVLGSAAIGAMYGADMIPENRQKLMVFSQVLIMLIGALMGSQQMIEGVSDLFRGRFTLNMMLVLTFLASCADAYFCL